MGLLDLLDEECMVSVFSFMLRSFPSLTKRKTYVEEFCHFSVFYFIFRTYCCLFRCPEGRMTRGHRSCITPT